MPKTASRGKTFSFLNKTQLVKLRLKAMRAGVWFRALPRIDRVLVDLTIRVAGSIRSVTLAKNILAVTRKLEKLLESRLLRAFRGVSARLAQKLSLIAQKWGNTSAKTWASNVSFIKFLAVMHINEPKAFKT
jgi:galactitol-specific phosphotransferase system IIC component